MKNWDRNKGIGEILSSLRSEMASSENRKTKQPAEGMKRDGEIGILFSILVHND